MGAEIITKVMVFKGHSILEAMIAMKVQWQGGVKGFIGASAMMVSDSGYWAPSLWDLLLAVLVCYWLTWMAYFSEAYFPHSVKPLTPIPKEDSLGHAHMNHGMIVLLAELSPSSLIFLLCFCWYHIQLLGSTDCQPNALCSWHNCWT